MMNADVFTPYLMAGESLVWWGPPRQGFMLTARDGFLIPFSLMWGGFSVFWETTAVTSGAPLFFKLWGVPFVVMGLYIVFGRFLVDAWARRQTLYAVTNKRVLILRDWPFTKFTALGLDQMPVVEFKEGRNGRGTIFFGPSSTTSSTGFGRRNGMGVWSPAFDSTPQFVGIDDARNVFTDIQNRASRART